VSCQRGIGDDGPWKANDRARHQLAGGQRDESRGARSRICVCVCPVTVLAASGLGLPAKVSIQSSFRFGFVAMQYLADCVGYAYYLGDGQTRIAGLSR
jgi:hypothetical protein